MVAERVKHLGHSHPGVECIALQFAQRLRLPYLRAVGVNAGVPRVLPSHIFLTLPGSGPVLLKPVTVQVAIAVNPFQTTKCYVTIISQTASPRPAISRLHAEVSNTGAWRRQYHSRAYEGSGENAQVRQT